MGPSKVRPPPFFGMLCQHISDIIGRTGGQFMEAAQSRTGRLVLQSQEVFVVTISSSEVEERA